MVFNTRIPFWAVMLLFISSWDESAASQDVVVGLDCPWCRLDESELTCNFDGNRHMVLMTESFNASVLKVSIHNAHKLHLSESLCVSVSLNRVAEVVVVRGESEECQQGAELTAIDSTLDRLPSQVTRLHLENSRITSLSSEFAVTNLTAVGCHIDVLDFSRPIAGLGSSAVFQDSTIRKLEKLEMGVGSLLAMTRTTVNVVASKGLLLLGTQAVLIQTVLWPLADDSVVMAQESTLSLENCPGNFKFKSLMEKRSHIREMEKTPAYRETEANYFIGFVVCLVFVFVLCFISIFACVRLRKERSRGRIDYLMKSIRRNDSAPNYFPSPVKNQRSLGPELSISTRPLLNTMSNLEEKAGSDLQNYLKEITRIEESLSNLQEQTSCDVASLKTSRAERIIELHSRYSTLRQLSSENEGSSCPSSEEEDGRAKEKKDRMKKGIGAELKGQGIVNSLLATEKAKLSLLESEYDGKIFEIMISSWKNEMEQKADLAQVKDSFINCLKENRDSAMTQVFKIYENDFDHTRKVRLAKDFVRRVTGKIDEEFKDQLHNQKTRHQDEMRSAEKQADDQIRILKNRHEVNKDSVAGRQEPGSSRPKNEGFNDLFQTLEKTYDVTYSVDVKKASAECDPKMELRHKQDIIELQDKYIAQLLLLVDAILLLGNIVQGQV